jgi:hypothetical protein
VTVTGIESIPRDLRRSLVSASISRGCSDSRAETSGTYLIIRFIQLKQQKSNVLVLSLSLLLLQSERDTTDGSLLNTLHQMGGDCESAGCICAWTA